MPLDHGLRVWHVLVLAYLDEVRGVLEEGASLASHGVRGLLQVHVRLPLGRVVFGRELINCDSVLDLFLGGHIDEICGVNIT